MLTSIPSPFTHLLRVAGKLRSPGRSGQQQRCEYHKHDCEELHGFPLPSRLICGVRLYPNSSRISLLFKRHEPYGLDRLA